MDQNTARTLAREVGTRATTLGVEVDNAEDPCCAELIAACRRSNVEVSAVLVR
jgi:hypothetical protein